MTIITNLVFIVGSVCLLVVFVSGAVEIVHSFGPLWGGLVVASAAVAAYLHVDEPVKS